MPASYLILLDLDSHGLAGLQTGGLRFVHVDAAAVVAVGDGEAGDRIAFQRDQDPVFVPLAPALAADFFREVAGQDDFGFRLVAQ